MAGKAQAEKRKKFQGKHPEGRKAFAAEKALVKQKKRQEKEVRSGHKGHNPKPRKVLKNK